MKGRILAVSGSDSGGGAGVEADIKTATALGAYAATAITALTAQNTLGITAIHPVPPDFVTRAMASVLQDIGADAIKTGMLHGAATVAAVADMLERYAPDIPLVIDPVMVSSSGTRLLSEDAIDILIHRLIARAAVITPNIPEAAILLGRPIDGLAAMQQAAADLRGLGARVAVVTGGHLAGATVHDVIADADGVTLLTAPRLDTGATHGTGCTFATAAAVGLAQGLAPRDAIARAHAYVHAAIRAAPGFGRGNGPLNHAITL
ncbi:MAG TPA: bifunctional hydroxymethylpyrimidine kinase/phosphomethylpyrimidine kinase [Stellaceae bacterium]